MSSETSIDARVAALSQKSPEELSAYVDGIFTKLVCNPIIIITLLSVSNATLNTILASSKNDPMNW